MHEAPDFAVVFNASSSLYLLLAADLAIVGVNEAYLHAAGKAREQLIGRNVFDAFYPVPKDATEFKLLRVSFARVLFAINGRTHARKSPAQGGAKKELRKCTSLKTPV